MTKSVFLALLLGLALVVAACTKKGSEAPKGPPATSITTVAAAMSQVQLTQKAIGQVDSRSMPAVAAEVAGRVVRIDVDEGSSVRRGQTLAQLDTRDQHIALRGARADVERLQALIANQASTVRRNRELLREQYLPRSTFDESQTQLQVLRAQLASSRAQMASLERKLRRARIVSPVDGRVQARLVSVGDFVGVGKPLFQIVNTRRLRVHLPFPETLAAQLHPGLPVRLTSPTDPGVTVNGRVSDVRPLIGTANRALDVIVAVPEAKGWRPGASVNGEVILAEHPQAVMVPAESVVQRPAGEVVYVIENGRAHQRVVTTGVHQAGRVEIVSGLRGGERIAVAGAGFLTDNAPVTIQGSR